MRIWSQFLPKDASKDGLDFFSAFRNHLQKEDIDDLEQRCPAMDHFVFGSPCYKDRDIMLLIELKHFLSVNSIAQLSADETNTKY